MLEQIILSRENQRIYGLNVKIKNHWIRHAQKMSGEVFAADKTKISTSSISPKGAEAAYKLGTTYEGLKDGTKAYTSTSARTKETVEKILSGYGATNQEADIRGEIRARSSLNAGGSPEFIKLYDTKWTENKKRLLAERGLALADFSKLSPDDQQEIAEAAEEPVIREWLDNAGSELAQLQNPEELASIFAKYFSDKHEMAKKLKNNSEIELFNVTHKTATEPFLASGVLIDSESGKKITKLEQLGGSLGILDNWDSEVVNDGEGKATIFVYLRGKKYDVDMVRLKELIS